MAEDFQSLYDDYVEEYGKPKEAKHLITYGKKNGKIIKFSQAKQLIKINQDKPSPNISRNTPPNISRNTSPNISANTSTNTSTNTSRSTSPNISANTSPNISPNASPNTSPNISPNVSPNISPNISPTSPNISPISSPQHIISHSQSPQSQSNRFVQKTSINKPKIASLDDIIKPLATVKPMNVSKKTDDNILSLGSFGDDESDYQNEIMYKTAKTGKFIKKKGTGTTPKALSHGNENDTFFNNPWIQNDKKKGHQRKSTPIMAIKQDKLKKGKSSPIPTLKRQSTPKPFPNSFVIKPKGPTKGPRPSSPKPATTRPTRSKTGGSVSMIASKFEPMPIGHKQTAKLIGNIKNRTKSFGDNDKKINNISPNISPPFKSNPFFKKDIDDNIQYHVRSKTPPVSKPLSKPQPISKYWIKPKGSNIKQGQHIKSKTIGLAQAKPLDNKRRMELNEYAVGSPKAIKKAIKKKKWDKTKEKQVIKWINKTMGKEILKVGGGKDYLRNYLENGQLLCRLINKIKPGLIDKKIINQKPNNNKFDKQRVSQFINSSKQIGLNQDVLFDIDDLMDNKNMMAVLNGLYSLKEISITITKKKKIKDTPLSLWCKHNKLSSKIIQSLKNNKYDLEKLIGLKSDDIETLCDKLKLNVSSEKILFMKSIIKLKESPFCEEWIILKDNFYCNLKTKKIFHIENDDDIKKLIKPILLLTSNGNKNIFLLNILNKYFDKEWFVDTLLSLISRISENIEIWKQNITKKLNTIFEFKRYKPMIYGSLYSSDLNEIRDTKLSYNLMELISNENGIPEIDKFILKYYKDIILHSLSVFHPKSAGNPYHGRIILDILLDKCPNLLFETINNNKNIELLLKYAIFTQLDHGNLSSFILELISFQPRMIDQNGPFKTYKEYLVSRCAYDEESCDLFKISCKKTQLMDTFLCGLLNNKLSKINHNKSMMGISWKPSSIYSVYG